MGGGGTRGNVSQAGTILSNNWRCINAAWREDNGACGASAHAVIDPIGRCEKLIAGKRAYYAFTMFRYAPPAPYFKGGVYGGGHRGVGRIGRPEGNRLAGEC